MPTDLLYYQQINRNIAAIINGHQDSLYHEPESEDISELSIPILQKKLKKMNEQLVFYQAENRLLYNYLIWYEKKILQLPNSLPSKPFDQILKHKTKPPLSIDKKREIAEVCFKVLLAYSQKHENNTSQYVEQCINTRETDDETIDYLDTELITLNKYRNFHDTQKRFTAEEFAEFFRDRIRYREALNERKRQKSVRLRFNLDGIEKSIRKVHQIVDTVTEVDFEQLKLDLDKQIKELNLKNKMLIFYKRQQSEANMKFNAKKPELFNELRTLASIRNDTNHRIQQLTCYEQMKQKLQDEIKKYEKLNEPLRGMNASYRVPSILNYVDLKSRQIQLHRQEHAWERKVQIAEREFHLRQIDAIHHPEKIIHPWKYLENPSSILFYRHSNSSSHRPNEINASTRKSQFNPSLPKRTPKSTFSIAM